MVSGHFVKRLRFKAILLCAQIVISGIGADLIILTFCKSSFDWALAARQIPDRSGFVVFKKIQLAIIWQPWSRTQTRYN